MTAPAQNYRIGIVAATLVLVAGACGGSDTPDAGAQPTTTTTATQTTGTTPAPTGDTTPSDTTTTSPTEEAGDALEWLAVGEFPLEANVPADTTFTSFDTMWSVRTSDNFEFRVWLPPDPNADTPHTLEDELARAEKGIRGDLLEVLLNETGDPEWFLGYVRDDVISGEIKWVLLSVRSIGDVKYDCTSTSLSAEAYEFALGACRTLRAAE